MIHYTNHALGKTEPLTVVLPDTHVGPGPFPTVYLLHGIGGDETEWLRDARLDRRLGRRPLVAVMPTTPWHSMFVDAEGGPPAATAIAKDLVDFVDSRLPVYAEPAKRAICGLSMGGYGALHIALGHPGRFGAAASHAGVLGFGHHNPDPTRRGWGGAATARLLGPSPRGGPCDLFAQAAALPADRRPALRFDCGTEDGLLAANRALHAHLEQIGYAHEYAEHPGGHNGEYWGGHVLDSIDFFTRTLGWPAEAPA